MRVLFDLTHASDLRPLHLIKLPKGKSESDVTIIPIKKGVSQNTPDKEKRNLWSEA